MKRLTLAALLATSAPASAQYGMIIPSESIVAHGEARDVAIALSFSHPFEGNGMELATRRVFRLYGWVGEADLLPTLAPDAVMGAPGFTTTLPVARPGMNILYTEPMPCWEPAEAVFVVHHTKTYITAFGIEDGWDEPIDVMTEIVPMSKPCGLYAGNLFQGLVLRDGKRCRGLRWRWNTATRTAA